MSIYIILLMSILVLGFYQKRGGISVSKYCKIIGFLFVLITGLRSNVVGSDTTVYYMRYERLCNVNSLHEAIANYGDIAYYAFAWLYAHNGLPFWCLTLTVALFFYFTVTRFIIKYSVDPTLSLLILMAFNFFQFSMTGIRQTIAFGFMLLTLYEAFKPKSNLKTILIYILIGYFFHNSCVICLLIVPMLLLKNSQSPGLIIISILIIATGLIFRTQMVYLLLILSADSRFSAYNSMENQGAGFTTYLLYFIIYIVLLYNKTSYIKQTQRGLLDFGLLVVAIFFQALVLVEPVMFRIAWYFSIALIIILPQIINTFSKSNRAIANTITYAGVLFMYLGITMGSATVLPYKFFWQ